MQPTSQGVLLLLLLVLFFTAAGFAIAYAYSGFLCVSIKLYLLLAYLTTGLIGYGIIEVMERRRKKEDLAKKTDNDEANEGKIVVKNDADFKF